MKKLGGFDFVNGKRHWQRVRKEMGLQHSTSSGATLKRAYSNYFIDPGHFCKEFGLSRNVMLPSQKNKLMGTMEAMEAQFELSADSDSKSVSTLFQTLIHLDSAQDSELESDSAQDSELESDSDPNPSSYSRPKNEESFPPSEQPSDQPNTQRIHNPIYKLHTVHLRAAQLVFD